MPWCREDCCAAPRLPAAEAILLKFSSTNLALADSTDPPPLVLLLLLLGAKATLGSYRSRALAIDDCTSRCMDAHNRYVLYASTGANMSKDRAESSSLQREEEEEHERAAPEGAALLSSLFVVCPTVSPEGLSLSEPPATPTAAGVAAAAVVGFNDRDPACAAIPVVAAAAGAVPAPSNRGLKSEEPEVLQTKGNSCFNFNDWLTIPRRFIPDRAGDFSPVVLSLMPCGRHSSLALAE